jgi:hypothetical protein
MNIKYEKCEYSKMLRRRKIIRRNWNGRKLKKGPLHSAKPYAPRFAISKNSYGGNKNR